MDLKGIEVYRFTLKPSTLAAPKDNPDNMCFCRDPKITKNCTMAGVLDISSCKDGQLTFVFVYCFINTLSSLAFFSTFTVAISTGTPIYISLPHFLYGSASLTQDVLGLKPSEEDHFTFLDVEPVRAFKLSSSWILTVWSINSDASFYYFIFPPDNWIYLEVC